VPPAPGSDRDLAPIWSRLRDGPVWILVRARPGLGRLTEALALVGLLEATGAPTRLLTSPEAAAYARRISRGPVGEFALAGGPDPQQALIDSRDLQRLLSSLSRARPAALVVHGYPLLLPLLRRAFSGQLVAMANLHDLSSPGHTANARFLAAELHSAADLVLVGELRRGVGLERVGSTPLLRLPALVRPGLLSGPVTSAGPPVAVLGGGSRGDRRLRESDRRILDRLEAAVVAGDFPGCRVFPGDDVDPQRHPHLQAGGDRAGYARHLLAARLVVARAGRSSLAELLALGRRGVVIPARSDTLRGLEQLANATRAAALSPAISVLELGQLGRLRSAVEEVRRAQPRRWIPGNDYVLERLTGSG
jgi:hypothetical protein